MLLKSFEYVKPNSLAAVLDVLDELKDKKSSVLAGGTDLIPWLRAKAKEAEYLVDLEDAGLNQIAFDKDNARIGAMVTFATLCQHPEVGKKLPSIAEAAGQVGAVQTRTLATIGGNLCAGVPSLDSAPSLLVLDAQFRLQSKGKERMVPAEKFFLGPRRTVLQPGEIMTEIVIPIQAVFRASFQRMGRRRALTLSIVNCAAGVSLGGGSEIAKARIALGAVAPTPIRAYKAEQLLQGSMVTPELLAEAAAMAATETSPIGDLRASADYRRKISAVLVRRALENAIEQTRQAEASTRAAAGGAK
jgi:carbon-monoxide dehydrogenase medium subunit